MKYAVDAQAKLKALLVAEVLVFRDLMTGDAGNMAVFWRG